MPISLGFIRVARSFKHFHVEHRSYSTGPSSQQTIRALIIGAPGSGKGTLSSRLLRSVPSLQAISAGDLLRSHVNSGSKLGQKADEVIRKGSLMPDQVMMDMVGEEIEKLGRGSSWLLDGFPRTREQASLLDKALEREDGEQRKLNLVLHLDVPNDVVLSRILDRWIHEPSGRTYNDRFSPPKVKGKDDVTGEALVKRADDDAETFEARLTSFEKSTRPMIEYYADHIDTVSNPIQPLYVRFRGTSSNEIWPILLKVVKDRFGSLVQA